MDIVKGADHIFNISLTQNVIPVVIKMIVSWMGTEMRNIMGLKCKL